MDPNQLAIILCAIKSLISPDSGEWTQHECKIRANEFVEVGHQTDNDPLLLIAISIYECDLNDNKDVIYSDATGIVAKDVCPMGLHVKGTKINQFRAGLTRKQVIFLAGHLLHTYKVYHHKKCKPNHTYIRHYNVGYQHLENGYDSNVWEIYTALKTGKSTFKKVNSRTQEIAFNIRRSLGYTHGEDSFKGCRPRYHCTLASNGISKRSARHHQNHSKTPKLAQNVLQ